jgi:hypothetical protein
VQNCAKAHQTTQNHSKACKTVQNRTKAHKSLKKYKNVHMCGTNIPFFWFAVQKSVARFEGWGWESVKAFVWTACCCQKSTSKFRVGGLYLAYSQIVST